MSQTDTQIAHGLRGVVLSETRLSMIDGQAGKLVIGGFALEELAPRASFEEVLYLLWHNALPTKTALAELKEKMTAHRALPEITLSVLRRAAERKLPPMDALRLGADTLSLADEDTRRLQRRQLAPRCAARGGAPQHPRGLLAHVT